MQIEKHFGYFYPIELSTEVAIMYNRKPPIVIMNLETMKSSVTYLLTTVSIKKKHLIKIVNCIQSDVLKLYCMSHDSIYPVPFLTQLNMQDIKFVWHMVIGMIEFTRVKAWQFYIYFCFIYLQELPITSKYDDTIHFILCIY